MSELEGNEIVRVVNAMIGETEAYGSEHIDRVRFENQEKLLDLTEHLLQRIEDNIKYADRVEHSMKRIGEEADRFFLDIVGIFKLDRYVDRKRKGKWVSTDLLPDYPKNSVCCTRCNGTVNAGYAEAYKYCPYCGTAMKGEE